MTRLDELSELAEALGYAVERLESEARTFRRVFGTRSQTYATLRSAIRLLNEVAGDVNEKLLREANIRANIVNNDEQERGEENDEHG